MLKNGSGRLAVYLTLTHGGAAVLAVAGASWASSRGIEPGWQIAGAALLGALLGWAFTAAPRAGIEAASSATEQLADGLPLAALPGSGRWLLPSLFAGIEALAQREREWSAGQFAAVRQAEENAAQNERNRLARDLHDSIKQQLFSINTSAATALARWEDDPEGAKTALADVRQSAREANAEMQALLQQLRPTPLDRAGLMDALREQCEALAYRTGAEVTTDFAILPAEERMPPGAQEALFRIAQEALSNIARHARATKVHVQLGVLQAPTSEPALVLEIADDGQGFTPEPAAQGMGLHNIRERAQRTGAVCTVNSAPGEGTTVRVRLPLVTTTQQEREETMNATIQTSIRKGVRAHYGLWAGLGLALFMALSVAPVIARTLRGGPQFAGLQILIPAGIALAGLLVAGVSYARLRRAQRNMAMTAGAGSTATLRLAREIQGHEMWFVLTAVIVLPLALLRQNYEPLPAAATVTGAILAALSVVQILRQRNTTEAYFTSLKPTDLKAEVSQAWSQRYALLLALALGLPAYIVLLVVDGTPVSTWFALPPGPDQAINYVVTFYLLALVAWVVVNYRQMRKWHARVQG